MDDQHTAGASAVQLVCPRTLLSLEEVPLEVARERMGVDRLSSRRSPSTPEPVGETPTVLLRSDHLCAYPIVDGFPVLLGPESLSPAEQAIDEDLSHPHYAEAYSEMHHYNAVAQAWGTETTSSPIWTAVAEPIGSPQETFPAVESGWLDSTYDILAQRDAYEAMVPAVRNRGIVCQVGGHAAHALKLLLAGASEAWLLTPMVQEAAFSRELARKLDLDARFHAVIAIGEEPPFANESFDGVISGGSLHHVQTRAFGEQLSRILRPHGRLGAWDPWRSPLFRIGTAIFGRREKGVDCRPLEARRISDLVAGFDGEIVLQRYSPFLRYPLIVLAKLRLPLRSNRRALRLFNLEHRLFGRWRLFERLSSSAVVTATKSGSRTSG